jgi:hypothetical protein
MWMRHLLLAVGLAGVTSAAFASPEVSILSGVFRNESYKNDGKSGNSLSSIGAGARFADQIEGRWFWYTQGDMEILSYSKGGAAGAPSSAVNLNAGGGVRYYFDKLTDHIEPYGLASGSFRTERVATPGTNGYSEVAKNGLYYRADFGIRISLQREFFVDFEVPLFRSALFASEKTTDAVYGDGGTTTTTSSEKTRFELFAASTGTLDSVNVALGYRF